MDCHACSQLFINTSCHLNLIDHPSQIILDPMTCANSPHSTSVGSVCSMLFLPSYSPQRHSCPLVRETGYTQARHLARDRTTGQGRLLVIVAAARQFDRQPAILCAVCVLQNPRGGMTRMTHTPSNSSPQSISSSLSISLPAATTRSANSLPAKHSQAQGPSPLSQRSLEWVGQILIPFLPFRSLDT